MPTMIGHLMFHLLTEVEEPVDAITLTGWELWNGRVRLKMGIGESTGSQYEQFKRELSRLQQSGYLTRVKPKTGRNTAARSYWVVTQEGQDWWLNEGVEEHFGENSGPRRVRLSDYIGRPLHKIDTVVPLVVWKELMKRYTKGRLTITFNFKNDDED